MGLQVWLPLNGDLHNQGLYDLGTITNNNTTINANGKIGSCYEFVGTNSSSLVKTGCICIQSATAWSVACWFYRTTTDSRQYLVSMNGTTASNFRFTLNCYNNHLCVRIAGTDYNTSPTLTVNQWYHGCFTYDNGKLKIYLNGELLKEWESTTTPSTTTGLNIGMRGGGAGYFSGRLNDVRIYDHCLSDKEISEIAKGLIIHYKLDQPNSNLLNLYPKSANTTQYNAYQLNLTENLVANQTYTLQLWDVDVYHSEKTAAQTGVWIYWGGGSVHLFNWAGPTYFIPEGNLNYHADYLVKTFTVTEANASGSGAGNSWLNIYNSVGYVAGTMSMHIGAWKLEKGELITPQGGDNENKIYDCSGYQNDGIFSNVTTILDSKLYDKASSFSGSTSYIKVSENKWMAQYAKALTINLWVKNSSWVAGTHFFSCTESGGFNTEAGNSGYLRFPIYVCTNAEQTSYAYKYDSKEIQISALPINEWVMLTFIYDETGTKTYINGILHHTYTNTSYGIRFNTNARLFLGCEANSANPSTPYYNGQMNDFRLYYTALTEEQILELYNTSASIDNIGNIYARELVEK